MKRMVSLIALLLASIGFAQVNVREFGAKGDGATDDTAAIQKALDSAATSGGGRVYCPPGKYLIKSHLSIPASVTLLGPFDAPPRGIFKPDEPRGAILLAVAGRGKPDAEPFITLHENSALSGMIVFYPEQKIDDIAPYPWCVRGIGDNCTIVNTLLVNPYQAVDFGTFPAGRHYINGLYAHALKTGLFIDQCFDVGRVENVHFWPFWQDNPKVMDWTKAHGTAFIIGRTDWEYMTNCFCIAYAIGFRFIPNKQHGGGNAVLTQCGSDCGPLAVQVDSVQQHAGVSFLNGQFMSRVQVEATNTGPVKFTNCGFWGFSPADEILRLRGSGTTTLNACHFAWMQDLRPGQPVIRAESGGLTLTACEFLDTDPAKNHIDLAPDVESAIITANRFRSAPRIINHAEGEVVIANNTGGKGSALPAALDAEDAAKIAELWTNRLKARPAETYPPEIRLASAILAAGDIREQLLKSVAASDSSLFSARARDELALDAKQPTSRPIVAVRRYTSEGSWKTARIIEFANTAARMLWDDENLYVRIHCNEPNMSALRAEKKDHDAHIWLDDSIELFLCPSRITHRYQQLIINSAGAWYDGTGDFRGTSATAWNAAPTIQATRGETAWIIDLKLSWKDLNQAAPKPGETWSADLRRWRYAGGKEDYSSWSFAGRPPANTLNHLPEAFAFLRFEE